MLARTPRDVGLLVRRRRNELGWSQDELARRAGVSRPWLSHVETGHPRAELFKLQTLLSELGMSLHIEQLRRSTEEV